MGLQYTNRRGDTYHLQAGTTRTGKPRYYAGRKLTGTPLDELPEGYEVREDPERGLVVLRKIKPSSISEFEREQVRVGIPRHGGPEHILVDIDGDGLIVYLSSAEESDFALLTDSFAGPFSPRVDQMREWFHKHAHYTKMLRFELEDPVRRRFTLERWCFRGSIDDWIYLDGGKPLADLVKKYAKHLGKESFYDLI